MGVVCWLWAVFLLLAAAGSFLGTPDLWISGTAALLMGITALPPVGRRIRAWSFRGGGALAVAAVFVAVMAAGEAPGLKQWNDAQQAAAASRAAKEAEERAGREAEAAAAAAQAEAEAARAAAEQAAREKERQVADARAVLADALTGGNLEARAEAAERLSGLTGAEADAAEARRLREEATAHGEAEMLAELKTIPARDIGGNLTRYEELVRLRPDNAVYRAKYDHYAAQRAQEDGGGSDVFAVSGLMAANMSHIP